MKHAVTTTTAILGAALAMGAPGIASAEITRQNAAGMCQGALPAFDTQIRKRPLAIRNEGTQPAFVSCSLPATNGQMHSSVEIIFANSNAAPASVNCTVVTGRANFSTPPQYYTLPTLVLQANQPGGRLHTFDNAVDAANTVNVSCNIPAGVSLDYIRWDSVDPV